jgi:hypothetical protein
MLRPILILVLRIFSSSSDFASSNKGGAGHSSIKMGSLRTHKNDTLPHHPTKPSGKKSMTELDSDSTHQLTNNDSSPARSNSPSRSADEDNMVFPGGGGSSPRGTQVVITSRHHEDRANAMERGQAHNQHGIHVKSETTVTASRMF